MKKNTHATLQRRQHRKARHTAQRQAQRRARRRATAAQPSRGQAILHELFKTIQHFFPDLLRVWRRKVQNPNGWLPCSVCTYHCRSPVMGSGV